MTEDTGQAQEQQAPNRALSALQVMVGAWDLKGRVFTTDAEISGQSTGRSMKTHSQIGSVTSVLTIITEENSARTEIPSQVSGNGWAAAMRRP